MKSKLIKALIISLVLVSVGFGGYYGYTKYIAAKPKATTAAYFATAAKKMNLKVDIQGTGAVYAAVSKDIMPNNSGTLSGLNLKLGDTVKQGAALFTANSDQLSQAVTKDKINIQKQQLQLSLAKTDDQITSANLAITDAQNSLNYDQQQLNRTTVYSPINGLVIAANNTNGDNVQNSKAVLTIIDPNSLKIKVQVDELDIAKVKAGQKATISVGAIKDKTFDGVVETISPTGTTTNNVTTYDVVVSISNPENIKLGMNASVNIQVDSKDNALAVPVEAVIDRNGSKFVMVAEDGSTRAGKLVPVKTGLETQTYVEITEGLTEAQKVLVSLPQVNSATTQNRSASGFSGFGGGGFGGGGNFGGAQSGKKGN